MNKILGYVIAVLGVIGLAGAMIPEFGATLPLENLDNATLIIVSLILASIGVFIIIKGGGGKEKQMSEVPIYHGKNVVGYRRTGKK
jgi:hypothetical protein